MGRKSMGTKFAAVSKKITRRAALGGAAAMVAAPALAEQCRLGPPQHAEGPHVWMNMDQVELDAAYDQSFYAPLRLEIIKRYASASEALRKRMGPPQRESYGPTPAEKLDIYKTKRPNAPIFVFIHGPAEPRAAVDEHENRSIRPLRLVDVELLGG